MNILFFDTETTGVPKNYKVPVTDLENWPRMVQLGYLVHHLDNVYSFEHIIRPDGFLVPEQVSKIHGITQEKAATTGRELSDVLRSFSSWLDETDLLVGHNVSFDLNVLGAEYIRSFGKNPLEGKTIYDTMLKGTNLCRLPGGRMGYKWPKLHELYLHLFHEPLAQSHTALDDIQNTAKCYFEMQRLGIV